MSGVKKLQLSYYICPFKLCPLCNEHCTMPTFLTLSPIGVDGRFHLRTEIANYIIFALEICFSLLFDFNYNGVNELKNCKFFRGFPIWAP